MRVEWMIRFLWISDFEIAGLPDIATALGQTPKKRV